MVRHISTSGETHASMAAAGMMLGLKQMFADFRPADCRPGTQPIAMLERYDSLAARVGYSPPIPADAFDTVVRMSLDARRFDEAARAGPLGARPRPLRCVAWLPRGPGPEFTRRERFRKIATP